MPLRIAVVTPFAFPSVRGNAVTVERIAGGPRPAGGGPRGGGPSVTPAAGWSLPAERVLFVFPAGIRMVKQPLLPLAPFDRLVQRRPQVRLLYVGPVLDPDQGEYLLGELASRPWARHVGAVPHGQMRSLLAQSDVVLNCSISEGGMSNSVLEALAAGRPLLASDIDGNRSLVEDGVTGFLFRDTTELEAKAEQLAADRALLERP